MIQSVIDSNQHRINVEDSSIKSINPTKISNSVHKATNHKISSNRSISSNYPDETEREICCKTFFFGSDNPKENFVGKQPNLEGQATFSNQRRKKFFTKKVEYPRFLNGERFSSIQNDKNPTYDVPTNRKFFERSNSGSKSAPNLRSYDDIDNIHGDTPTRPGGHGAAFLKRWRSSENLLDQNRYYDLYDLKENLIDQLSHSDNFSTAFDSTKQTEDFPTVYSRSYEINEEYYNRYSPDKNKMAEKDPFSVKISQRDVNAGHFNASTSPGSTRPPTVSWSPNATRYYAPIGAFDPADQGSWPSPPSTSLASMSPDQSMGTTSKSYSRDLKIKKQGDTTIITQHRDPYSFYWQLDRAKPQERGSPEPEMTGENAIDEYVSFNNGQTMVKDASPVVQNFHIRPDRDGTKKPVKRLSRIYEIPISEKEAQFSESSSTGSKKSEVFRNREDPNHFSHYWQIDQTVDETSNPENEDSVNESETDTQTPRYGEKPRRGPLLYVTKVTSSPSRPFTQKNILKLSAQVLQSLPSKSDHLTPRAESPVSTSMADKSTSSDGTPSQPVIIEEGYKQTVVKKSVHKEHSSSRDFWNEDSNMRLPVRFAVRSMGNIELTEEEMTQESNSSAVNKAIVDLSIGNAENKFASGKEIILELDERNLRLLDSDTGNILNVEPVSHIRVWGVGSDNGRDFAYVARDRTTHQYLCHVFRCDTPAHTIAEALRFACRRLSREQRSTLASRFSSGDLIDSPMNEPKKVIRCHFLGVTQVPKATGIEILNEAVDRLVSQVRFDRWVLCDVAITPSLVSIAEVGGNPVSECRVRHLSFLGIGRDIKLCAFIIQDSSQNFMCYVFHVEPSAATMAKTIEAACKLRFQKAINASSQSPARTPSRGLAYAIRDAFGSLTHRRPSGNGKRYSR